MTARLAMRLLWLGLVAGLLWMVWSWHTRPLVCETLVVYPPTAAPHGELVALARDEACSDGGFSTEVRTVVEVGARDAGVGSPVLTVWETQGSTPAVVLEWTGPAALTILLARPRDARLHAHMPPGMSVQVLVPPAAGRAP